MLIHHDYLYLVPACVLAAALFARKAATPLDKGGVAYSPWLLLGLALVAVVCCALFYDGLDGDRRILIISAMGASGGAIVSITGSLLMATGALTTIFFRSLKDAAPIRPLTTPYLPPTSASSLAPRIDSGALPSHLSDDEETKLA